MDNKEISDEKEISQTTSSSKLKGCYLLIILSAPKTKADKEEIIQRVAKALLSWNTTETNCDLKELQNFWNELSNKKEVENNESDMLIQYSNPQMAIEILYNAENYTVKQCLRNLFQSFTAHKQIIFSGYTFAGSGNWILNDSIFTVQDFIEQFNKSNSSILNQYIIKNPSLKHSIHLHCLNNGEWCQLEKKITELNNNCRFKLNPSPSDGDGVSGAANLIDFLQENLNLQSVNLNCSEIVGNIRFQRPTFYIMPSGQGDCSVFGVNGFTCLIDGGFNASPSCWSFIRHLEKIDSVLITRFNENNSLGLVSLFEKLCSTECTAPKIGRILANFPDLNKLPAIQSKDNEHNLEVNLIENGQNLLRKFETAGILQPQPLFRPQDLHKQFEPIELYHRIGFGTLNLYVLNPLEDSKLLKEFLIQFNEKNREIFSNVRLQTTGNNFLKNLQPISLSNITSIALVIAWLPAELDEQIVRVLLPGSTPNFKILEAFSKLQAKHSNTELNIMLSHENLTRAEFDKLVKEANAKQQQVKIANNLKATANENLGNNSKMLTSNKASQRNRSMSPAVRIQDKTPQFYDSLETLSALNKAQQNKNLNAAVNKKLIQSKSTTGNTDKQKKSTANVTANKTQKTSKPAILNKSNTKYATAIKNESLSKEKGNQLKETKINDKKASVNKIKKPKLPLNANLDFTPGNKAKSLGSMSEASSASNLTSTNTIKAYLRDEYEPDSLEYLNSAQSTLSKDSLEPGSELSLNKKFKEEDEDSLDEQEIKKNTAGSISNEPILWNLAKNKDDSKDFSLSPIEKQRNELDNIIMNQSTLSTKTVIETIDDANNSDLAVNKSTASIPASDFVDHSISESNLDSDFEYKEEDAEVQKIFESETGLKRKILVLENNEMPIKKNFNEIDNDLVIEKEKQSIAVINKMEVENEFNQSAIINYENSKIKNKESFLGDINNNSFLTKSDKEKDDQLDKENEQLLNSNINVPDKIDNDNVQINKDLKPINVVNKDNLDEINKEVPTIEKMIDIDAQINDKIIDQGLNEDKIITKQDSKKEEIKEQKVKLPELQPINKIKLEDDKEKLERKLSEEKKIDKTVKFDEKVEVQEIEIKPELKDEPAKTIEAKEEVQEEVIVPKEDVTKTGSPKKELELEEDVTKLIKNIDLNKLDGVDKLLNKSPEKIQPNDKSKSIKDENSFDKELLKEEEKSEEIFIVQESTKSFEERDKDDRESSIASLAKDDRKQSLIKNDRKESISIEDDRKSSIASLAKDNRKQSLAKEDDLRESASIEDDRKSSIASLAKDDRKQSLTKNDRKASIASLAKEDDLRESASIENDRKASIVSLAKEDDLRESASTEDDRKSSIASLAKDDRKQSLIKNDRKESISIEDDRKSSIASLAKDDRKQSLTKEDDLKESVSIEDDLKESVSIENDRKASIASLAKDNRKQSLAKEDDLKESVSIEDDHKQSLTKEDDRESSIASLAKDDRKQSLAKEDDLKESVSIENDRKASIASLAKDNRKQSLTKEDDLKESVSIEDDLKESVSIEDDRESSIASLAKDDRKQSLAKEDDLKESVSIEDDHKQSLTKEDDRKSSIASLAKDDRKQSLIKNDRKESLTKEDDRKSSIASLAKDDRKQSLIKNDRKESISIEDDRKSSIASLAKDDRKQSLTKEDDLKESVSIEDDRESSIASLAKDDRKQSLAKEDDLKESVSIEDDRESSIASLAKDDRKQSLAKDDRKQSLAKEDDLKESLTKEDDRESSIASLAKDDRKQSLAKEDDLKESISIENDRKASIASLAKDNIEKDVIREKTFVENNREDNQEIDLKQIEADFNKNISIEKNLSKIDSLKEKSLDKNSDLIKESIKNFNVYVEKDGKFEILDSSESSSKNESPIEISEKDNDQVDKKSTESMDLQVSVKGNSNAEQIFELKDNEFIKRDMNNELKLTKEDILETKDDKLVLKINVVSSEKPSSLKDKVVIKDKENNLENLNFESYEKEDKKEENKIDQHSSQKNLTLDNDNQIQGNTKINMSIEAFLTEQLLNKNENQSVEAINKDNIIYSDDKKTQLEKDTASIQRLATEVVKTVISESILASEKLNNKSDLKEDKKSEKIDQDKKENISVITKDNLLFSDIPTMSKQESKQSSEIKQEISLVEEFDQLNKDKYEKLEANKNEIKLNKLEDNSKNMTQTELIKDEKSTEKRFSSNILLEKEEELNLLKGKSELIEQQKDEKNIVNINKQDDLNKSDENKSLIIENEIPTSIPIKEQESLNIEIDNELKEEKDVTDKEKNLTSFINQFDNESSDNKNLESIESTAEQLKTLRELEKIDLKEENKSNESKESKEYELIDSDKPINKELDKNNKEELKNKEPEIIDKIRKQSLKSTSVISDNEKDNINLNIKLDNEPIDDKNSSKNNDTDDKKQQSEDVNNILICSETSQSPKKDKERTNDNLNLTINQSTQEEEKLIEDLIKEQLSDLNVDSKLNINKLSEDLSKSLKKEEDKINERKESNFGIASQSASNVVGQSLKEEEEEERRESLISLKNEKNTDDFKIEDDNLMSSIITKSLSSNLDSKSIEQIENYTKQILEKANEFVDNLKNDESKEILEPDLIEEVESSKSSHSDSGGFEFITYLGGVERRHSHSTSSTNQSREDDQLLRRASESASSYTAIEKPHNKLEISSHGSNRSSDHSLNSLIGAGLAQIATINSAIVTKSSLTPDKEQEILEALSLKSSRKSSIAKDSIRSDSENVNEKQPKSSEDLEFEKIDIKEIQSIKNNEKQTEDNKIIDTSFEQRLSKESSLEKINTDCATVVTTTQTTLIATESNSAAAITLLSNLPSFSITTHNNQDSQIESKENDQKYAEIKVDSWSKPLGLPPPLDQKTKDARKIVLKWNPLGLPSPFESRTKNFKQNTSIKTTSALNRNQQNGIQNNTDNDQQMLTASIINDLNINSMKQLHFELLYISNHGEKSYNNLEFFKKCNSKNYVLSASNPDRETLDSLLEARKQLNNDLKKKDKQQQPIILIPTHESESLFYWLSDKQKELENEQIEVAPSASRCSVTLQGHEDEVCQSYRIQF